MDSAIAKLCVAAARDVYSRATIQTARAHVLIRTTSAVPIDAAPESSTSANGSTVIVVAFRGTRCVRDFITDAEFFRIPFFVCAGDAEPAGAVHAGFLLGTRSVIDTVHDAIISLQTAAGSLPVFLTGHSLGAAQAKLAAMILERRGVAVAGVYSFGSPRVGDRRFRDAYDAGSNSQAPGATPLAARTFRFVNQLDIVPRVPGWLAGFRHVGQCEFFMPPDAPFALPLVTNPHLWLMALSDGWGIWRDYRIAHELSALEDHHIDRYVAEMETLP